MSGAYVEIPSSLWYPRQLQQNVTKQPLLKEILGEKGISADRITYEFQRYPYFYVRVADLTEVEVILLTLSGISVMDDHQ